jgi:hypothetical protein
VQVPSSACELSFCLTSTLGVGEYVFDFGSVDNPLARLHPHMFNNRICPLSTTAPGLAYVQARRRLSPH